ncbi:PLAC8 family-domain-containing protein [Mycena capillaripes]|nr:PLAC8 family-domain-containing protein [Mycena capillaripes]
MQVAPGGSRNFKNMAIIDGEREWSNDVFDCFSDPLTCIVAWFVPCIVYGHNRARFLALESYTPWTGSSAVTASSPLSADCVAQCFGCGGIVGMMGRRQTRTRYGIHGSGGDDCIMSCCCAPCTLTQESREIELEEQSLGHPGAGFSVLSKSSL